MNPEHLARRLDDREAKLVDAFFLRANPEIEKAMGKVAPGEAFSVNVEDGFELGAERDVRINRVVARAIEAQFRSAGWELECVEPDENPRMGIVMVCNIIRPPRTAAYAPQVEPLSPFSES